MEVVLRHVCLIDLFGRLARTLDALREDISNINCCSGSNVVEYVYIDVERVRVSKGQAGARQSG
jgi:hypothetical protein